MKRILPLVIMMLMSAQSVALSVNFFFTVPTAREDGTALTFDQVALCSIYEGDTVVATLDIQGGLVEGKNTIQLVLLDGAEIDHTATCTDVLGVESARSEKATINLSKPNAPSNTGYSKVEN